MNQNIKRGEIYYVHSTPNEIPSGTEMWADRPALIISNNTQNNTSGCVSVVYLTTSFKKRAAPMHIKVTSGDKTAIALCEQIHSVDKSRLNPKPIGEITSKELKMINQALACSIGLNSDNINYISLFKKWEAYVKTYHLQINTEQQNINSVKHDKAMETLKNQIEVLTYERDGYKNLVMANNKKGDNNYG